MSGRGSLISNSNVKHSSFLTRPPIKILSHRTNLFIRLLNLADPCCSEWHLPRNFSDPDSHSECSCGEEVDIKEWKWVKPSELDSDSVILSDDDKLVVFKPEQGTAYVRGDKPMIHNYHYYWEVKLLTKCSTYESNTMVGIATQIFNPSEHKHKTVPLLGIDGQSYGLCNNGTVQHNNKFMPRETKSFRDGCIIGIRLNMWQGMLQFYINRKCQGTKFFNLRRHTAPIFPMLSACTRGVAFKLVYASSWKASLFVDAFKVLSNSNEEEEKENDGLPLGLQKIADFQFWMTLTHKRESSKKTKREMVHSRIKKSKTWRCFKYAGQSSGLSSGLASGSSRLD